VNLIASKESSGNHSKNETITMNEEQRRFLYLTMIEGKTYDDVSTTLGVHKAELSKWWDMFGDERERMHHWRTKWRNSLPQVDFKSFYEKMSSSSSCYYCGIHASEIEQLFAQGCIRTKRNRGRELEVDRMIPNKDYADLDNLVLACYWCNNAKTDEFSAAEFKPIGAVIGQALRERLKVL